MTAKHASPSRIDAFLHRTFGPTIGALAVFGLEVVQIVIISAAIIIPIRYFLIQPFYVKGASMEPNFHDQEYLIIDELTYRLREPYRGEILVFRYPRDPDQFFIKRIVGMPGETVEVSEGRVTIFNDLHPNGLLLDESYVFEVTPGTKKVTLEEEEYYVLGDNRDESLDSRSFGPVRREYFIGRVWVRGLPLSRAGLFDLPEYNL